MEYKSYNCKDNPLFNQCTLILENGIGITVIQQHFNPKLKVTWWGAVNSDLMDIVMGSEYLERYFSLHAKKPVNGRYPTIEIRRLMYALGIRTQKRDFWETKF